MVRLFRSLPRIVSRFTNQLFRLCWLVPLPVADDERIVRAIYSPYHLDTKKNRLKRQAYDPTPATDEISVMRIEYMGPSSCRRKAQSLENPAKKKEYRGFAVLRVDTVRSSGMEVIDSRIEFCGHADIKLLMEELHKREPNEPLPPEATKSLKDLQERLLSGSTYVGDPSPRHRGRWRGGKLRPPSVAS